MLRKLKIVSLFSGIGGFELGLQELGEVIWANDWDKFASQTYRQAGNAVAVPVVQAIGTKIKESLVNFLTETGIYNLVNFK